MSHKIVSGFWLLAACLWVGQKQEASSQQPGAWRLTSKIKRIYFEIWCLKFEI